MKHDYSLNSSWVWRNKLGTPVFGEFLPFFSADPIKLYQNGCGALLHSYFQVSPEMFDRVQARALAGPLKDIQRLVPKPLLRCPGCVLRVVVLLEGPSLRFWVFWSRFLSRISLYFSPFIFASILTSFPSIIQHNSATTMLHLRHGAMFPPDVTLCIQAKEFNLGFIIRESCFSWSESL